MRKMSLCFAVLLSLSLVLPVMSHAAPTIKIAAAGPYTGDLSKIGLDALNAIKMAVDETNQSGGVSGRKIELVMGDDGADPSKALLVAEKLGNDSSILGVVGPMNSTCVAASLPSYQSAGLPIITPSASTSDLAERGFAVFHRLCSRDDVQGPVAARFMLEELKAKKVYVLDDKTTYGQSLADFVAKALKSKDADSVKRGQISADDKDFSAILTKIKGEKPDVVFFGLSSPAQAAAFIKQAVGLGVKCKFMGGNAQKEKDQYVKGASGLAEGSYVLSVGKDIHDVPQAKEFVTKFEKKFGAISVFSAQAYEATKVLLASVKKVADASKGKEIARDKVLKALDGIDDYEGIMGFPIGFNKKGDLVGVRISVLQVKNGDFDEVKSYPANTK